MKHHRPTFQLLTALFVIQLSVALSAKAATFSNFEPPTYVASNTFFNVDGWITGFGGAGSSSLRITPDPASQVVLNGSQSALINSGTRAGIGRKWGSSISGFTDPVATRISLRV